ncbi:MAG: choline dehydrogenase, partial [Gammaproteobacteria bacterium]
METDYVVVGAGSAGCVVASRLSEDGASVTLLEAGPADHHPMIHIPAGILSLLYNPKVNWCYASEPQEGSGNRAIHWPRGKVLGGSSSINGMLYVRGNPADYDMWAQRGCRGWSYDDVLPFFKKSERYESTEGEDEFRGRDGPLVVQDYRTILPLTHHFVSAAQQAGHALTQDYNGKQQDGVSYSQMTRRGRLRGSTARTFLSEAKGRSNLTIETNAVATRLTFEGKRCTGVEFNSAGKPRSIRARQEVIVCSGAVNSPHLLQVSGIGPAEHLQSIGIGVVHNLPGVGNNLSDHYVARISHRIKDLTSINELSRGVRLAREVGRWVFRGDGALTFGVTSAMVFCHSREGLASPDLQLLFTPASYDLNKFGALEKEAGMTVAVCPVRPDSRGTIMATSPDPLARPAIVPNYLSDDNDLQVLLSGFRQTREILVQPAL